MTSRMELFARIKKKREEKSEQGEFITKVLKQGSNKFRAVGDPKFVFQHWFISADGVSVKVNCHKEYDIDGNIVGSCPVCDRYREARKILNDEEGLDNDTYSRDEIEDAEIVVGDRTHQSCKYPSSWASRVFIVFNVIDRDDDWCVENNHTKIIAKSKSQPGLTAGKNGIWDNVYAVLEEMGSDYEGFDLKIKKTGAKMETKYHVFYEDVRELTDEEKEMARYDLEALFKPTPKDIIKKWLYQGVGKNANKEGSNGKNPTTVRKNSKFQQQEREEDSQETKKKRLTIKKKQVQEPEPATEDYDDNTELVECPVCYKMIDLESFTCPYCDASFE